MVQYVFDNRTEVRTKYKLMQIFEGENHQERADKWVRRIQFARKFNIWLHGKMKLCKQMNWNDTNKNMFFGYYGIHAKHDWQIDEFLQRRRDDVKRFKKYENGK